MSDINKAHYAHDFGKMSFVEFYGYIEQAAIYQAVVEKNTGKKVPVLIAAASKEDVPNIEIIGFQQADLDRVQKNIFVASSRIAGLRNGTVEPDSCGVCEYCRDKKVLTGPVHYSSLILGLN